MKILLVEDTEGKRHSILEVIHGAVPNAEVSETDSYTGALSALSGEDFELVILDIVIPLRSGGTDARKEHGIGVIREILEGDDLRIPNHLVCLSEYPDAFDGSDGLASCIVNMVHYSADAAEWAEELRAKILYAERRFNTSGEIPTDYTVDVGVVCSYPPVELQAIVALDEQLGVEFNRADELHYHRAKWSGIARTASVVACAAPSMGLTAACATASKLITRWRPRFLVMTGIAAGTDAELSYGDILVAETCYDYGSGKIREENSGRVFLPNPQQISIDRGLLALLQRWEAQQLEMTTIGRAWLHSGDYVPSLKLGVLASGAAVVQSAQFVAEVKAHARKVIGIEMEAYGVYQAANLASHPKPMVLVAKSVSDFADPAKDDSAHSLAAFTSAAFIRAFFSSEPNLPLL